MRFVDRDVRSIEEDVMGLKVIGVDPHERSHTAVALDDDEEIAAQLRVAADRRQVEPLQGPSPPAAHAGDRPCDAETSPDVVGGPRSAPAPRRSP
jgi:hypothetical protein